MTQPDPDAIAYYHKLFAAMKSRGIEPVVTLFHYVSPAWFFEADAKGQRGWERADALHLWQTYVDAVAQNFIPEVRIWCTLNEPMVYLYDGYVIGSYLAPETSMPRCCGRMSRPMVSCTVSPAHAAHRFR